MNRRELLVVLGAAGISRVSHGLAGSGTTSPSRWLDIARTNTPELQHTKQLPQKAVRPVAAPDQPLLWRMEEDFSVKELPERTLKKGDSFILDFGGHRTGYLSFDLETVGRAPDAPARLKLTFGEVPTDVAETFYPYRGELSSAWLPDELINVDYLPRRVSLPRRYAFRYVKIEVLDTSPGFAVRFLNIEATAVSSASGIPLPLADNAPSWMHEVDRVALATLRDCMQTTFEDGPRRDQRLWVGDLRLQALVNYATFKQYALVKRCLYLFAALPRADGLVAACVFEKPEPRYGEIHIVDYALLFNVALCDYVQASSDLETGKDLWPVALRQLDIIGRAVNRDGLFVDDKSLWVFIDWSKPLDRSAAIQSVLIYSYRSTARLAQLLGRREEKAKFDGLVATMSAAARKAYWDPARGLALSGEHRQISWASAAWMSLAGVLNRDESARALSNAIDHGEAVRPLTPYLYHYVIEALMRCGLKKRALELMQEYWGGMVRAGADTFWEAYDPKEPLVSPYGDRHINSYCHAWSCGPSYLFRAGLLT